MKTTKLFSLLLTLVIVAFSTSCSDDDPVIVVDEGIPVADGFYFAKEGKDPVATAQMSAASVDANDFGAQSREGFVQAYTYLTAGNYNLVEVTSKAVTATFGGASETISTVGLSDASGCGFDSYTLVTATADGAAFNVASDGLYVIAYDANFAEIIYHKIESVGIIGDATPGGWSSDTNLTGSIDATGGAWEVTGVILSPGSFKFRYNCRWNIDRRIDRNHVEGFSDASNGYSFFTNYGNTIDQLLPGNEGSNIEITERAEFTVTFAWDPITGVSGTVTRTGDAPPLSYDPADHPWSIRGELAVDSPSDWSSGPLLTPNHDGTTEYRWYGVIRLSEGTFKVSDGNNWVGFSGIIDNSGVLTEAASDNNIEISAANAGFYYFTVTTADEGATPYIITIDKASFGVIGDATPGGWDTDTDMTESGSTWSLNVDLVAGEWKFRANDAWEYNLGGDLTGLTHNGGNIAATAGSYTITLSTVDRGVTFTGTIN